MATKTVTDKIDLTDLTDWIAEPAFNLAALLRCARDSVMRLEDDTKAHSTELHAIQRTLAMCIDTAETIGCTAIDLPFVRS